MEHKLKNLGVALSRAAQKLIIGGRLFEDDPACPGSCETDKDCSSVNKGKCSITCSDGKKRCESW